MNFSIKWEIKEKTEILIQQVTELKVNQHMHIYLIKFQEMCHMTKLMELAIIKNFKIIQKNFVILSKNKINLNQVIIILNKEQHQEMMILKI